MNAVEPVLELVLEWVIALVDWTYGPAWSGTWRGALFALVILLVGVGLALVW
jgi:hypothetical protein